MPQRADFGIFWTYISSSMPALYTRPVVSFLRYWAYFKKAVTVLIDASAYNPSASGIFSSLYPTGPVRADSIGHWRPRRGHG